jgi:hypothetical protein
VRRRRTYGQTRRLEIEIALATHRGTSLRAKALGCSHVHCWRVARRYQRGLLPLLPRDEGELIRFRDSLYGDSAPQPSPALRWKRVNLPHNAIEVAESFSNGELGSPKTRSSNRVIPMSSVLQACLKPIAPEPFTARRMIWYFACPRARRSILRTYTTVCSRPHVTGSNNHECRGIRSGTPMRRSSRSLGNRSRPRGRFWATRIWKRPLTPTYT